MNYADELSQAIRWDRALDLLEAMILGTEGISTSSNVATREIDPVFPDDFLTVYNPISNLAKAQYHYGLARASTMDIIRN